MVTATRVLRIALGVLVVLAAAAGPSVGEAQTAGPGQPIVLKGITPWVADDVSSKAFFIFQKLVNERLKGKVLVSYLGGPEVFPPLEQFEALRNGVVDVSLNAAAYYRGQIPAAAAFQYTKRSPTELRKSGYYDLMRKLHIEQGNVVYLANTSGGNRFRLYMKKKIDRPDLSGLKIRVSPVYVALVKALNGTPISIVPGEIYTALERAVVDGFGWTSLGITQYGWHEVSKYVIEHPFYSLDNGILFNVDVWKKLPEDSRAALEEIGVQLEAAVEQFIQQQMAKEDVTLRKAGMEFIRFKPDDAKMYVEAAYDAGWREYLEKNREFFAKNPGVLQQLRALGD